ncbi:hypothetical protein [Streptomyces sp. NBC_00582]|uniref:hypothetical protein n=1 Tax=Streptomyces sp. NBC_00582 TaxID=2975783 RepID=UPI0010629194|nr:hypothetical protein [Streptomyces sp. NBC_00582]WUB59207.1 hypothetical protein OG852_01520 [Streptomyces sp. NBC_00582]
MISRTAIKRTAVVGALSLASGLMLVTPASAATDISGREPFDTNHILGSICTGSTDLSFWKINVNTGEIRQSDGATFRFGGLTAPWETFDGYCSYPQSTSWTWPGSESQVSNTLVNCAHKSTLTQNLQTSGSTTSTTENSVSAQFGINWTALEKVLEVQAGGSYTHTWSYAKTSGWSTTTGLAVGPRRVGWLSLRPVMRTVRSNPVFHIYVYKWDGGKSSNWRGRNYNEITSYGAYYDAIGEVIKSDGSPEGQYVAHDRPVRKSDRC